VERRSAFREFRIVVAWNYDHNWPMNARFPAARPRRWCALLFLQMLPIMGVAQVAYQKPPLEVLDVLNAPVTPGVSLSPARDRLLLVDRERYPSISEIAQPMLGLAGVRINPQNRGPYRSPQNTGITIQTIPAGETTAVKLPPGARFGPPVWAPDGSQFAFAMFQPTRIDLWVADARTGAARKLDGSVLNAVSGSAFQWMPDSRTLLCRTVPETQGPAPIAPATPSGPNIQESFGKTAPVRTYQDLLKNAHDEAQFEYYATSQLVLVNAATGRIQNLAQPGIFAAVDPSPGGEFFLVTTVRMPFSRLLGAWGFPSEIVVWDRQGKIVHTVATLPSQEGVPIEGVPTGPRAVRWRPTTPATLVWAEALDGGNPKAKAAHRDRLLSLPAPFRGEPAELLRFEHRYTGAITWGERDGLAFVSDYDRDRRWQRTFLIQADRLEAAPRLVWERSVRDRYRHPGTPLLRTLPNGERVLWQSGNSIYLAGSGASPGGDYPFLDKFDLETFKTERLFQSDNRSLESVVTLVSAEATGVRFITAHETLATPSNYRLRTAGAVETKPLTHFPDPTPQLRKITKRLVTYKRADGVPLSFTLYLPPDYQPGQKLPTLVWAYPLEYNDAETAGQVSGSTNRFTTFGGPSHLFFLLRGYAVLDGATMPIVGSPETMNDTFIKQIVDSAQAAIDKAVELGVTDPGRVGVGGHSYGAFMTANLLAHSDLFRAGIARSGAYNRTLTPFGFQGERRTFWEAPDIYARLSPFMHAHKINEPILLIHGERDDNPGTFPVQSERFYQAVKGNGGNVRYVTLPFEAHGYAARESIEHTLHEMLSWFDQHVKNAPGKSAARSSSITN
jgi:dipeptidyl aminopeptidase/acylaminoacyl peptidase